MQSYIIWQTLLSSKCNDVYRPILAKAVSQLMKYKQNYWCKCVCARARPSLLIFIHPLAYTMVVFMIHNTYLKQDLRSGDSVKQPLVRWFQVEMLHAVRPPDDLSMLHHRLQCLYSSPETLHHYAGLQWARCNSELPPPPLFNSCKKSLDVWRSSLISCTPSSYDPFLSTDTLWRRLLCRIVRFGLCNLSWIAIQIFSVRMALLISLKNCIWRIDFKNWDICRSLIELFRILDILFGLIWCFMFFYSLIFVLHNFKHKNLYGTFHDILKMFLILTQRCRAWVTRHLFTHLHYSQWLITDAITLLLLDEIIILYFTATLFSSSVTEYCKFSLQIEIIVWSLMIITNSLAKS